MSLTETVITSNNSESLTPFTTARKEPNETVEDAALISQADVKRTYLTQSDILFFRPSWTRTMIKTILGEPDMKEEWRYKKKRGTKHLYSVDRVMAAESTDEYYAAVDKRPAKYDDVKILPLLDAIREASKAAHRWRDSAQDQYRSRAYGRARFARKQKEYFYELKEAGILAAHRAGDLRYAGETKQRMAVYEYGDGGRSCFHSLLHPAGSVRVQIADHPEVLLVPSKKAKARMKDVEHTLSALLPLDANGYERVQAPKIDREIYCHACDELGHITRDCSNWESWYSGNVYESTT